MADDDTGIWLTRTDEDAPTGGVTVGLEAALEHLDRRARRSRGATLLGRSVRRAYTWDDTDRGDRDWWPQGISSSGDASPDGRYAGRELLAVAWYSPTKLGSRVTFVDLRSLRYRHVRLVESDLSPLHVHAGGLVWCGPYLHVAATGRGLVTAHVDDIRRTADGLVLPVRHRYRAGTADGHRAMHYSFVSLDRSGDTPVLLAGEYAKGEATTRFATYGMADSGLLAADAQGVSHPLAVRRGGLPQMQGAVSVHGRVHVTVSHGRWAPGSLHVGQPGEFRERRLAVPMGPEDLAHWPQRDEVWSVTEHPGRRWFFSVRPSKG